MNKIKILIEGMTSNLGGLESYIMTQYKYIDSSIFHHDFIFWRKVGEFPDNYRQEIENRGGRIFYVQNRKAWSDFLSSHTDYDFFISNTLSVSDFIHKELCKHPNTFKHIIIHSHIARKYPFRGFNLVEHKYGLFLLNKFYPQGIEKWACSDIAGKWLFGNNSNYTIIRNGIYTDKFAFNPTYRKEIRDEFNITDTDFIIGNVGRIHTQKNQEFLIEVFAKLKEYIPNVKLILVGGFQTKIIYEYQKLKVCKYKLESSVIFAGSRKDTYKFYSAFDVFALPSRYEGFPIVGIEAQTAGLPCLFSNTITKDIDIRKKGVSFLPITQKGIDEWVKAIVDIYNDKDRVKLRDKSESADIIAEAGYDVRKETKRVETLLISYLDKDRRKSLGL